jgi:hypothetical protein
MNTVLERLLESWLDSQGERHYQSAFIQLLVSEGWTVLHNTRHSPIEFGKDVIARDTNGILHCFQLKGNPGTRITKTEAQGLIPQLLELIEMAPSPSFRRKETEKHIAVLVTNGNVDEEARLALEAIGSRTKEGNSPASQFFIWSRGILLQKFLSASGTIWPTTVNGTREILNFLAMDGQSIPPPQAISKLLAAVASPSKSASRSSNTALLTSLLVLAEVIKSPFYQTENHFALYQISTIVTAHALRLARSKKCSQTILRYSHTCLEHCNDLLVEAEQSNYDPDVIWFRKDVISEFDILWERRRLIAICAATLILSGDKVTYNREYASNLVSRVLARPRIWGFAAVPSVIAIYWATTRIDASIRPDFQLAGTLQSLLNCSLGRIQGADPLASPYYPFEDCWAKVRQMKLPGSNDIHSDSFTRRAWFCRSILFMLAKRNYKQTCKSVWSSFSESIHEEPRLHSDVFLSSILTNEGTTNSYTYHYKTWNELLAEAVCLEDSKFLDGFEDFDWLIAAYISLVPYRAWSSVIMWLDNRLNMTWYTANNLPDG